MGKWFMDDDFTEQEMETLVADIRQDGTELSYVMKFLTDTTWDYQIWTQTGRPIKTRNNYKFWRQLQYEKFAKWTNGGMREREEGVITSFFETAVLLNKGER